MTFRFGNTEHLLRAGLEPFRAEAAIPLPANDNGAAGVLDAMLHAALRHFADHGLAAAHHARRQAEAALLASDQDGYCWWLEICRALDGRMASAVERRAAGGDRRRP